MCHSKTDREHCMFMEGRWKQRLYKQYSGLSWQRHYLFPKMLSLKWICCCKEFLTHSSLETPKRVTGKQFRPRSDAAERGVWSGSPLFANTLTIFFPGISKTQPDIPKIEIRIFQYIMRGSSFSLQWVNEQKWLVRKALFSLISSQNTYQWGDSNEYPVF